MRGRVGGRVGGECEREGDWEGGEWVALLNPLMHLSTLKGRGFSVVW